VRGRWSALIATGVLALAVLAAPSGAAGGATATASGVRDCNLWASYPNVKIDSARNMTCRAARRQMRRYKGSISRRFTTPGGFHCHRVSGNRIAGQWRCTKGVRAFRFDFSD
jgi:hypothetical protein